MPPPTFIERAILIGQLRGLADFLDKQELLDSENSGLKRANADLSRELQESRAIREELAKERDRYKAAAQPSEPSKAREDSLALATEKTMHLLTREELGRQVRVNAELLARNVELEEALSILLKSCPPDGRPTEAAIVQARRALNGAQ